MNTPLSLGFVALIAGGIAFFFSKVGISNGVYIPAWITLISLVHTVTALAYHHFQKEPFYLSTSMLGLGLLCGVLASISYFAMLIALKMGGDASVIFPLVGLGVLVAVPLSFIFLDEPVTATKLLGLGLGVGSITLLSR